MKKFGFPQEIVSNVPVEPPENATFLTNSIYVFGLDSLSTDNVKTYFSKVEFEYIGWLNDSSCKSISRLFVGTLKFKTDAEANSAMQTYGIAAPDKMSKYWKKGPPTTINGKSVVLIFRYATALVF